MTLVAVTICINYSDYLECVVGNRVHFDRWVVVSVPEDRATHELCARFGVECIDSALLQADGRDFHAVDNKGPVLNEGIAHVLSADFADDADFNTGQSAKSAKSADKTVWCVVLDADVLLPRYFGERVRAMPLESGCLYAMGGRKVCETREQFEMLRPCEPWDRLVARNSQAIGYFNLFSLEALPNRYPVRTGLEGAAHDDFLFTTSFAPGKRRVLPFTAIHLGIYGPNWGGRITPRWETRRNDEGEAVECCDLSQPSPSGLVRVRLSEDSDGSLHTDGGGGQVRSPKAGTSSSSPRSSTPVAAVIGYFPGGGWQEVTRGFFTVYLVDHFCVHVPSGSGMIEGERTVLRRHFDGQTAGDSRLRNLGVHSVDNVNAIPDGSLDLLYIPGEVAPEWLCRALPHWLPKMREGGVICGDVYGLPHWPDATYTIALLLGTPERVEDGRWWKTFHRERCAVPLVNEGDGRRAVVFVNTGTGSLEQLSLSLFAARKHWDGWLVVMHHGEENESLRILCARLGVDLVHASLEEMPDWDELLEECAKSPPCPVSMLMLPWHLPAGGLVAAFDAEVAGWPVFRGEPRIVDEHHSVEGVYRPPKGQSVGRRFPFATAQVYGGSTNHESVVVYSDDASSWSEAAWEARCEVEADAALAAASRVRLAVDTTVVAVVTAEDAGEFQRNWLTWNFSAEMPVIVLLEGMSAEELWLPGAEGRVQVIALSDKQAGDLAWLLGALANTVKTRLVAFLAGTAAALPGAELWGDGAASVLHATGLGEKEREVTGNDFVPAAVFAQLENETLRELAPAAHGMGLADLATFFHRSVDADFFRREDAEPLGWKFPPVHRVAGKPVERTNVEVRTSKRGLLELADDVVVISLPERKDRRARIVAMMEHERVAFRFSDGVRVTDEQIDPQEIAEVGRAGFKEVGSFAKYLRGMVGCRRAHLRVLEKAHATGLESLLIFEDDAHLTEKWLTRYRAALKELPTGWHQLYLSASPFRRSAPFSTTLWRIASAYQTTAILYSKQGIEVALQCLRRSRSEIDHWMGVHLHPFGNSYSVHPSIAYQEGGVSDIMSFNRGITP